VQVDLLQQVFGLDIVSPFDVLFSQSEPALVDSELLKHKRCSIFDWMEWNLFRFEIVSGILECFDFFKIDLLLLFV
jgi:hypothetical protein